MLHIYHGTGKGKTTAAIGLALRMIGHHKKTFIIQFLKDGSSGEISFLQSFTDIDIKYNYPFQTFYFQMSETEQTECKQAQYMLWKYAMDHMKVYDCIVLDELLDAINLGFISVDEVIQVFQKYKQTIEIVITGRNPDPSLLAIADYETLMSACKHPYEKGIEARIGVEF